MSKLSIEAEGGELILQNENGDYSIIPKKDATRIQMYMKKGQHDRIDKYVSKLPLASQYAEDGTIIADPGDGFLKGLWHGIKRSANPKNWGKADYTAEKDFGSAYQKARGEGAKEFTYKGERYNTKYDGTPEQQLRETGITDNQMHDRTNKEKKLSENLAPFGYQNMASRYLDAAILNNKSPQRVEIEQLAEKGDEVSQRRLDAFSLYTGVPQKYNTFSVSKYKPSKSKEASSEYLAINSDELRSKLLEMANVNTRGDEKPITYMGKTFNKPEKIEEDSFSYVDRTGVMGQFKIDRGEDERGKYVSYYDKWDMAKKEFGKPFEIYDRVYYEKGERNYPKIEKISEDIKKVQKDKSLSDDEKLQKIRELNKEMGRLFDSRDVPVTYTSSELSKLDTSDLTNINIKGLQKDLYNKGYDLPNSTKKDGSFDGVWGEETEAALNDWKQKNK